MGNEKSSDLSMSGIHFSCRKSKITLDGKWKQGKLNGPTIISIGNKSKG